MYLTLALSISYEVSFQTALCSWQQKQMLTPHKLFIRLLMVVHNTLYSY